MEYTINVAKQIGTNWYGGYIHYFKVVVPYGNVKKVYEELKEKFPNCKIEVYKSETISKEVDMDKCTF